jgi:hypothetical protein
MAHTNGIIEIDQVPYGIGGEPGRSDSPHTMRTVTNPMARPYDFKWNGKDYRIKAGETQHLPEFLSFHAARGIAKEILAEQRAPKDLTVRMVLYTENDVVKVMQELIDVNTAPSRAVNSICENRTKNKNATN